MSIQLASFITPKVGGTYFIVEDKHVKGGLHSCVDHAERDAISSLIRKAGMVVVTQNDMEMWILSTDLTTWAPFTPGTSKVRTTLVHDFPSLLPGITSDAVSLPLGGSCFLMNVSVNVGPCDVAAYSTPGLSDSNPYLFKALASHLVDDGTTYMTDGTSVQGRRYTLLANMEVPPTGNIYWTITNRMTTNSAFTLSLSFLPLE